MQAYQSLLDQKTQALTNLNQAQQSLQQAQAQLSAADPSKVVSLAGTQRQSLFSAFVQKGTVAAGAARRSRDIVALLELAPRRRYIGTPRRTPIAHAGRPRNHRRVPVPRLTPRRRLCARPCSSVDARGPGRRSPSHRAPALPPDFLIIGGQRCGTTTLYQALSRHPSIAPPLRKEPQYFTLHADKGDGLYRAHFPTNGQRRVQRPPHRRGVAHLRGHAVLPVPPGGTGPSGGHGAGRQADRARCATRSTGPTPTTSTRGVAASNHCPSRPPSMPRASGCHAAESHRLHSYVARGRYAEQLERWLSRSPASRCWCCAARTCSTTCRRTVGRVVEFLGLSAMPAIPLTPAAAP